MRKSHTFPVHADGQYLPAVGGGKGFDDRGKGFAITTPARKKEEQPVGLRQGLDLRLRLLFLRIGVQVPPHLGGGMFYRIVQLRPQIHDLHPLLSKPCGFFQQLFLNLHIGPHVLKCRVHNGDGLERVDFLLETVQGCPHI